MAEWSSDRLLTSCTRAAYIALIATMVYCQHEIQHWINVTWDILKTHPCFTTVYFETGWTVLCNIPILIITYSFHQIRSFDRYKINPETRWEQGESSMQTTVFWAVQYATPLLLLDTFMVKKYHGVDPHVWVEKRKSLVQTTRALPDAPPTLPALAFHLAASLVVFDAIFCLFHYALHKNRHLYKHIHAVHHDHGAHVYAYQSDQVTVIERIVLVLSANESLKLFNAHPLTRACFVPIFLWWLADNHSGFDVPWSLEKIIPFGIMSGSRRHWDHHVLGTRNYAPFFTYLDAFFFKLKIH